MECTRLVLATTGRSAHAIFGSPDDLKLCSCMTLFDAVAPEEPAFRAVLDRFYAGVADAADARPAALKRGRPRAGSVRPVATGAELGPVELLHQHAVGVVADDLVAAQLDRALPRDRDRAAPQRPAGDLVERRSWRRVGVQLDDRAVLLAQQLAGERLVVPDRVEQRL